MANRERSTWFAARMVSAPAPRALAAAPPSTQPAHSAPAPPQSVDEFTGDPTLRDVFFEPGRADIGRNSAKLMRDNVRWIVENPGYLVLIEGLTDYKGSRESNRAMANGQPGGGRKLPPQGGCGRQAAVDRQPRLRAPVLSGEDRCLRGEEPALPREETVKASERT